MNKQSPSVIRSLAVIGTVGLLALIALLVTLAAGCGGDSENRQRPPQPHNAAAEAPAEDSTVSDDEEEAIEESDNVDPDDRDGDGIYDRNDYDRNEDGYADQRLPSNSEEPATLRRQALKAIYETITPRPGLRIIRLDSGIYGALLLTREPPVVFPTHREMIARHWAS